MAKYYRIFLFICLTIVLFAGCSLFRGTTTSDTSVPTATSTLTPTVTYTPEPTATSTNQDEAGAEEEAIIITPTPAPTATPGPINELVSSIADATGASEKYFLGLGVEDWINLVISGLIIFVGGYLGGRLIFWILQRLIKRTQTEYDDALLEAIKSQVLWFVVVITADFATTRLLFLSVELKEWLDRFFFVLYVLIILSVFWKLVDFSIKWYDEKVAPEEKTGKADVLIPVVERLAKVTILAVGVIIILDRFGVNVTALTAMLGIAGLAFSLAAQDTLADAIAGFTILLDQPFLVGHRIEISELGTWGDVVEIGTRTTRIRTRDNRLVIVPNSIIAKSQVVNYTYPDPRYRVEIDIGIGYGMDIEKTRQIIIDTVSKLDGILKDRPVDALYNEMGDSAMIFRVRWWIGSYEDKRRIYDRVNTALQVALDEAGIEMPFPIQEINLKIEKDEQGDDGSSLMQG
jgi:small-conductance mechanosensitive channel